MDDVFGTEAAAARLTERLELAQPGTLRLADDGRPLLWPPFAPLRDRFEGPASARTTLVVFGAHGTPLSPALGRVLATVREDHPSTVAVAWRHYPDPVAHPCAALLALAVEAAADRGHFWALTRELLRLHHDDPADVHAAMLRAGLDPERTGQLMRSGTGADRIVDDVASALASGVAFTPVLFVNGERYEGRLEPTAVSAVLATSHSRYEHRARASRPRCQPGRGRTGRGGVWSGTPRTALHQRSQRRPGEGMTDSRKARDPAHRRAVMDEAIDRRQLRGPPPLRPRLRLRAEVAEFGSDRFRVSPAPDPINAAWRGAVPASLTLMSPGLSP